MTIKGQMAKLSDVRPRLTVIGVGGAGCNAVNNMIASGLVGVEFIVANTDAQALAASSTEHRLQLGATLTEGLGAGSRPEIGEAAAEEAIEDIRATIRNSHMVFIAAGMGGGTGTGAASVIARAAKELGILTVGVVTKPFLFEGARRMRIAEVGVAELRQHVDTLIVIPNQNLFRIASEKTTFSEAFVMADQVLYSGVACIVDLIVKEGLINLDFADVRTVMTGMGSAMMGTGEATGERRATMAAEEAISNPLLDDVSLKGAKGLLLSITGGPSLTLYEVDEAASRVRQEVDPDANIIVGATYDPTLGDKVRVSIVASGMARAGEAERAPPAPPENWIRGHRPGAVAAPPPLPPRELRGAGPQELQRRLTEALQHAQPPAQTFGVQRQPYAAARGEPPPTRARAGEPWRGPGNVTIEDGPPQLASSHAPPPLPSPSYPAQQAGQFAPQPPAEVRRAEQRRAPEPGQDYRTPHRAYRHPKPAPQERDQYHHQQPEQPAWQPAQEPRRRLGLFERITGRMRGSTDSVTRQHDSGSGYAPEDENHPASADDGAAYDPYAQAAAPYEREQQDVELPVFFKERRK